MWDRISIHKLNLFPFNIQQFWPQQQQKLEESLPLDISILLLGDRIFK